MTVSSHSLIGSAEYNEVTNTKFYYGCLSKRVISTELLNLVLFYSF